MTIEEMRSLDAEKTYKELMWERSEVLRLTTANLQLREGVEELKQRIQRWHDTLTPLMPSDLKSWHENNPSEWPEVTAWVITSQRERINQLEAENDALRADLLLWREQEVKP
jgi:hypothetical protein